MVTITKQIEDNLKKALINVQPYEKKLIKENILSTDIIHIYNFYELLTDNAFELLFDNDIIESIFIKDTASAFIFNTVYGQYLIIDNFSLSKGIKTYPLFQNYALVLMKYESFTNAYIIAKGNNIVFKLKFDKESKELIIDDTTAKSPINSKLTDNEVIELLALSNTQYVLYTLLQR